jgi:hypothetical protein
MIAWRSVLAPLLAVLVTVNVAMSRRGSTASNIAAERARFDLRRSEALRVADLIVSPEGGLPERA